MGIGKDIGILAIEGARHSLHRDVLREVPRAGMKMLFGTYLGPRRDDRFYMDLHVHVGAGSAIKPVLEEASKRVDLMSIVTRTKDLYRGFMSFEDAKQKMRAEGVDFEELGSTVVKARVKGRYFYVVKGTEVYAKENQGVILLGAEQQFEKERDLALGEIVDAAESMNTFWFFDHPFSVWAPAIGFRYPTQEEFENRIGWMREYQPVIETANHQNTLWMFPSNLIAQRVVKGLGLVGIGTSDSHFNPKDIGLTRTSMPRALFDGSSEEGVLKSLRGGISPGNKDLLIVDASYCSIWSFGQYMVLPHLTGGHKE